MANKKIKYTSGDQKNPRLQISKEPGGEYIINYAKSDPLGLRSEESSNLDNVIKRLFGYESWQEYKDHNMLDLQKSIETNPETGKVSQAPTVHPFHVAYALEEFIARFNPDEYEIVGVSERLIGIDENIGRDKNLFWLNWVVEKRKVFFGDVSAEGGTPRSTGILNIAMLDPQEKLLNKDVIKRVKQRHDFDQIFTEKFEGEMPVAHPEGEYWNSDLDGATNKLEDAYKINISDVSSKIMLKEAAAAPMVPVPTWTPIVIPGGRGALKFTGPVANTNTVQRATLELVKRLPPGRAAALGKVFVAWAGPVVAVAAALGIGITVGWLINKWAEGAEDSVIDPTKYNVFRNRKELEEFLKAEKARRKILRQEYLDSFPPVDKPPAPAGEPTEDPDAIPDEVLPVPGTEPAPVPVPVPAPRPGETPVPDPVPGPVPVAVPAPVPVPVPVPGEDPAPGEDLAPPIETPPPFWFDEADFNYYILPKGWRKGVWLTQTENILSQRIGANTDFLNVDPSIFDPTQDAPAEPEKVTPVKNAEVLVYGHSQASAYGSLLAKSLQPANSKVTKIVHVGHSDGHPRNGLDKKLDKIPKKKYTHAFLFLGGNSAATNYNKYKANTEYLNSYPDYANSKRTIINFVISNLNISKENIVVVLPPVNLEHKKYPGGVPAKLLLNKRAEKFFKSLGLKVLSQVSGESKDFEPDGVHITSKSKVAKQAVQDMLGYFPESEPGDSQPDAVPTSEKKLSRRQIARIIVDESNKANVNVLHALTMALIEGYDPQNREGSYHGLYQFSPTTWAEGSDEDWSKVYDAKESAKAYMKHYKRNKKYLINRGIPTEPYLIYLVHNQGRDGLRQIYNQGQNQKLAGGNLIGPYAPSDPRKAEARAELIRGHMRNNWYGPGGIGHVNGHSPQNFLRDWKRRYNQIFLPKARVELASVVGPAGGTGIVAESKLLKQLFNIIERVEKNELV